LIFAREVVVMSNFKRCAICLSLVAMTWSPAVFADSASEPSALDDLIDAIVAIFVDDTEMGVAGQLGHEQEAGPSMPFIG
jgi:hypothetical protein